MNRAHRSLVATLQPDGFLLSCPAMKGNAEKLAGLMRKHGMTRRATYELLEVKSSTLNSWLAPEDAPSYRPMPNNMLRLLRLELGEAEPALPTYEPTPRRRLR